MFCYGSIKFQIDFILRESSLAAITLLRVYSIISIIAGSIRGVEVKKKKWFLVAGQREHDYLIIVALYQSPRMQSIKSKHQTSAFFYRRVTRQKIKISQSLSELYWVELKAPFRSHHKVSYFIRWTRGLRHVVIL